MAAPANIQCLPDNVLLEILSYLRAVEVARIGRVCKRWRDLSKDKSLWTTLDFSERVFAPQNLWRVTKRYAHKNTEAIYIHGTVTKGHPLQWTKMSDNYFKFICKTCPNLKIFSIEKGINLTGIKGINLPKTLHTLRITQCDTPNFFMSKTWWPTLGSPKLYPNLKHLDLTLCFSLSDDQLRCLLGHTGLVELVLNGCFMLTDISFERIATSFFNLEVLQIRGAGSNCSDKSIRLMARDLRKLKSLDLGDHGTDAGLRYLHKMKKLEDLSIKRSKHLTNAGIRELTAVKRLKKLSIRNVLSDEFILELGTLFPECSIFSQHAET